MSETKPKDDEPLYGDLPIKALAKFLDVVSKDFSLLQLWSCFGAFLAKYYGGEHGEIPVDEATVDRMMKAYNDEGHSGYSHLVVTQLIMEYLSGKLNDEDKAKLKELRK